MEPFESLFRAELEKFNRSIGFIGSGLICTSRIPGEFINSTSPQPRAPVSELNASFSRGVNVTTVKSCRSTQKSMNMDRS